MYRGFSLEGKNAIVTGGTRGIGFAIVKGFIEAGASVTFCGRKPEGVQGAIGRLQESRDRVHGTTAHVANGEDLERLVSEAEHKFGPVNLLVNNAGTNPYFGPIIDAEERAWDKTFDVNLKGPYLLSQLVARKMTEAKSGSIINIASIAGLQAAKLQGIYSVTKSGLISLTKVMAREFGHAGIRVNCICPGLIQTELSRALWEDEEALKRFVAAKALGRVGKPEEIVGAAIYFASDASSFTTGSMLTIDGGLVI